VLKAWTLPQQPQSGASMDCQSLPDHRPAYLDYEGPVSADRGSVTRWDEGTYRIEHDDPKHLAIELSGNHLIGQATLTQLPDHPERWRFSFCQGGK
jgi:predicted heme/steroid binding protein